MVTIAYIASWMWTLQGVRDISLWFSIFGHMIKLTLETANLPQAEIRPLFKALSTHWFRFFKSALVIILSPYASEGYGGWEGSWWTSVDVE